MALFTPRSKSEIIADLTAEFSTILTGQNLDVLVAWLTKFFEEIENQQGTLEAAIQSTLNTSELKIDRGNVSTYDAVTTRLLALGYINQVTFRIVLEEKAALGTYIAPASINQIILADYSLEGIICGLDVGDTVLTPAQQTEIADLILTYSSMGLLWRDYADLASLNPSQVFTVLGTTATGHTGDVTWYVKEEIAIELQVTLTTSTILTDLGISTLEQEIIDLVNNNEKMGGGPLGQFNPALYDCKVLELFDTETRQAFGVVNAFVEYRQVGGAPGYLRTVLSLALHQQIDVQAVNVIVQSGLI